ncbi:hypothetical protein [Falsarthrobacter nasiphocae]|uniref:Membrane protein n=1 Tax=Falsarthrobacter nasiphocae TaxID=189863 RepID=A0AAE3YGE0_9MICC|nr:hypothetical protein [Falsarthrobacter nasiphocae]MDR6891679.1 putative membrane protein [Falsarthrobacter nasiphocae]
MTTPLAPGPQARSAHPRTAGLTLRMSSVLFAIMVVVFLVAIVFAANSSTFIGWLVAIIFGGWLAIFAFLVFTLRAAAKKAGAALDSAQEELSRQRAGRAPAAGTSVVGERDSLLDEKLDHSFKIVEVQKRVIADERAKGAAADEDVIERALETIEITASNARDMIRPDRRRGSSETITGTVL